MSFFVLVKPIAKRVKELRLSRDDFEMLSLIGKGAFGEASLIGIFLCWRRISQKPVKILLTILYISNGNFAISGRCCKNEEYGSGLCSKNSK